MSIIATVGRRSFGVSTLIASMYLLLTVGGASMVYPFLLMLSTATTTPGDMQEYRIVPAYFHNDNALYRKYLWLRYDSGLGGASARDYNKAYTAAQVSEFRADEFFGWGNPLDRASGCPGLALPPDIRPDDPDVNRRADDLDRFLRESAVLWPGPPLTEWSVVTENGRQERKRDYVRDPHGQPLDPAGLTTGLGNCYRTVGYVGAAYVGFSGPGRTEWTRFLEQFYTNPADPGESNVQKISRLIARLGRPYETFRQVHPGYDMPASVSWSIVEKEYTQTDWLYYKAVWLSGAPVVAAQPGPGGGSQAGISATAAATLGEVGRSQHTYTDVLGRSGPWTETVSLRSLRPTQLMPDYWRDLKNRYMEIDPFNLAIGLARIDRSAGGRARPRIVPAGRDVVLARTIDLSGLAGPAAVAEPGWLAAVRALLSGGQAAPAGRARPEPAADDPAEHHYLLPPRIDPVWSRLSYILGLDSDHIARLNERIEAAWLGWLQGRGYRTVHLEPFADFDEVYLSARRPIYEPLAVEWGQFVATKVPPAMIRPDRQGGDHLRLPEIAWRDFLGCLYRDRPAEFRRLYLAGRSDSQVGRLVARERMLYGREFDQFNLARMPIGERDVREFYRHKGELRRHFMFGNFRVVLDELVLEGRAMFNTIVLIFLAVSAQITVNPLAAYALSRFRLAYTYKVLLFMLATMAFPPAVGMIPAFLLLKHFGLINTYAALVLPGVASGYTIFLLKGFFDALPAELYEAAEIDGAGKITTFLNVTFPLSKPIFAIITLNSFTAAYSGFMWAFLICPDSKMWTIMVHLFNIQQNATPPIAMAALVIAAVPTFLVFLFCQNVILRGIIIPSFK